MPRDLDGLADIVVLTVQNAMGNAMGPILQRLAAAEARLAMTPDSEQAVAALRDRVVAIETKASLAPTPEALIGDLRTRVVAIETKAVPASSDGSGERLAAVEARLETFGDVRDRVVAFEAKAMSPSPIEPLVGDLVSRVVALEAKSGGATAADIALVGIRDRLVAIETKAAIPLPEPSLGDIRDRLVALETKVAAPNATDAVVGDVREITKTVATVSERVAVVETRAPVPGPQGKDGKDGADGLGWDNLSVAHDGERTFSFRMMRGERVKDVGTFTVPVPIYRGVYAEGRTYEPGDTVTYGGGLFHCKKTTTLKPDGTTRDPSTGESQGAQGKDFWTLAVRRGTDGKDGRDAAGALPVVTVGARR